MIYHDLVIIGGGAAGLMAAVAAKDFGIDVAIVEGTDRVGKKILTTGNGRCNITNSFIGFPFQNYHSENGAFFNSVLSNFTVKDTIQFFSNIGLPLVELENGKMYPHSLQSSSVVDIFRLALEDRSISIYNSCKIKEIIHNKKSFKLFTDSKDIEPITCGKLILACGGKSASKTGSDGSGYNLAKTLGHRIIDPIPAIVQLKLDYKNLKAVSGIKFDGYAEVIIDKKSERKELGEILFTDYGISGPPILQLSRKASYALSKGKEVLITVDMMPSKSKEDVENFLENHWGVFAHRTVLDSLIGIVNKKLIPILLKEAGVDNLHKPCWNLDWQERKNIISLMKKWDFKCIGTNGFQNAQVTAGGVDTKEINPETLESKLIKNLFFCGEMLDVDGDCGGFNLQWAWSSAYVAAKAVSSSN
ncbi:BaiN/RdsA family NAD(P)/FAD-dependent oxidoreductase [Clostridium polyendosporum]|nr:NAD(P)/FAD-dependent oxidoreductase [Clostridium polyendosporum]